MRRITCVMLDMGGVLTQDQREDKVDEMTGLLGFSGPREAFLAAYFAERTEYDRGSIDGRGYWIRVGAALGIEIPERVFAPVVKADLESWFNMRPAMLEFLGGVKGKVRRTLLLSNIHFDGARYLREGEGRSWASLFDDLVLSCEHNLVKPEREIYELALGAAGALPAETLFVDDNEANVLGARAAGISSFRFAGEDSFAAELARDYEFSL